MQIIFLLYITTCLLKFDPLYWTVRVHEQGFNLFSKYFNAVFSFIMPQTVFHFGVHLTFLHFFHKFEK